MSNIYCIWYGLSYDMQLRIYSICEKFVCASVCACVLGENRAIIDALGAMAQKTRK